MSAVILRKQDGSTPPIPFDDEQRAKKLIASNHFLSQEKEVGPFMLYLLGDDIESVAVKCGYPKDIVLATAVHYRWRDKREALIQKGKESEMVKEIEKNLVNSLLLASWRSISAEVGAVMSGKLDPGKSKFVPQSIAALERLLAMAERVNKLVVTDAGATPEQKPGTTVVNAQNVQIVNNPSESSPEDRRRMLLAEMARASEEKE